jgi:hypothetical protein
MPRKPRKQKVIRSPAPHAPLAVKQRWVEWKNKQMKAAGSKWRYNINNPHLGRSAAVGLVGHPSYKKET